MADKLGASEILIIISPLILGVFEQRIVIVSFPVV